MGESTKSLITKRPDSLSWKKRAQMADALENDQCHFFFLLFISRLTELLFSSGVRILSVCIFLFLFFFLFFSLFSFISLQIFLFCFFDTVTFKDEMESETLPRGDVDDA